MWELGLEQRALPNLDGAVLPKVAGKDWAFSDEPLPHLQYQKFVRPLKQDSFDDGRVMLHLVDMG